MAWFDGSSALNGMTNPYAGIQNPYAAVRGPIGPLSGIVAGTQQAAGELQKIGNDYVDRQNRQQQTEFQNQMAANTLANELNKFDYQQRRDAAAATALAQQNAAQMAFNKEKLAAELENAKKLKEFEAQQGLLRLYYEQKGLEERAAADRKSREDIAAGNNATSVEVGKGYNNATIEAAKIRAGAQGGSGSNRIPPSQFKMPEGVEVIRSSLPGAAVKAYDDMITQGWMPARIEHTGNGGVVHFLNNKGEATMMRFSTEANPNSKSIWQLIEEALRGQGVEIPDA